MSEENKIDQSIPSQPVEDVFSNVEEATDIPPAPTPQEPIQENVNISESSIGQEGVVSSVQEEKIDNTEEKNQEVNTSKIFFYLILSLIILLGAFAIWALVF